MGLHPYGHGLSVRNVVVVDFGMRMVMETLFNKILCSGRKERP